MPNKWYYALDSKTIIENEKDKLTLFSYKQLNDLYKEKVLTSRSISVKKCSEVLKSRNNLRIQINNLSTTFKNLLVEQGNLKEKEKSIEAINLQISELEKKSKKSKKNLKI